MSRAPHFLLVCLALVACQRSSPVPPPVLSDAKQLERALTEARAASARLRAMSPLPFTSQPLPPAIANVLLWVNDRGIVIDDTALLDGIPTVAQQRWRAQRRGFGPRVVPDVIDELRALGEVLPGVPPEEWASHPPRGATWQRDLIGSLAAAPDVTVKQVLLAQGDVLRAKFINTRTVALRGDAGLVEVEVELRGPGFLEPELCAHGEESLPACVMPELELSSRGWCARPARGMTGFPCLLPPRSSGAPRGMLARLIGDAGLVLPDLGLRFPVEHGPRPAQNRPRPAQNRPRPEPAVAAAEDDEAAPCEPVPADQLLAKVAELVARSPGCVRSKVTAIGEARWGVLAPVLAELAAKGLPAGVGWRPDPDAGVE